MSQKKGDTPEGSRDKIILSKQRYMRQSTLYNRVWCNTSEVDPAFNTAHAICNARKDDLRLCGIILGLSATTNLLLIVNTEKKNTFEGTVCSISLLQPALFGKQSFFMVYRVSHYYSYNSYIPHTDTYYFLTTQILVENILTLVVG